FSPHWRCIFYQWGGRQSAEELTTCVPFIVSHETLNLLYNRCNRSPWSVANVSFGSTHLDEFSRRRPARQPPHAAVPAQLPIVRWNLSVQFVLPPLLRAHRMARSSRH